MHVRNLDLEFICTPNWSRSDDSVAGDIAGICFHRSLGRPATVVKQISRCSDHSLGAFLVGNTGNYSARRTAV